MSESFNGPVFVVGIWRSGTSLLYSLLNQHSHLKLMYESDLLLLPGLFRDGHSRADWKQRWDFLNSGYSRHQLQDKQVADDQPTMAAAMKSIGRAYAGDAAWGCKSPSYYDRLEQLADMFPQARFIIIWRDPANTARSIVRAGRKSPWFAKRGLLLRALLGNRVMKTGCDALMSRGAAIHQLQYEDMVQDPEAAMRCVCEFLELPYEPKMATLEGSDRSAIFSADHHSGVKSEKIAANNEKRPEVLDSAMIAKIQRYVNYWRAESNGTWPLFPRATATSAMPSSLELTRDSFILSFYRSWDRAVGWVYGFAPVWILRAYRGVRMAMQPKERKEAMRDAALSARAAGLKG